MIITPDANPTARDCLQYASFASHDLLNHMTVLYGCSQLVMRTFGENVPTEFLHMQSTMRNLTDYICSTSEYRYSFSPDFAPVDLSGLLWNLPDYVDDLFETLHIQPCRHYSFNLPSALPVISGDCSRIRKSLVAIARNAVEATRENDEIKICASLDERHIKISISDNGGGIDDGIMDHLGKPFTTTKPGHAGLGLAAAAITAQRHNGFLDIESSHDTTCVTLALPLIG